MTRFLTLFDTVVTDPLEDIPTVNELEKWLKNVGEQAFYFLIRLAAAGLLLFIGSKLIKFLMNRFKRSKLYQKMDPGLASFMASGSRIVLYIILILMCFGVLGIETASFLALFTSGGVAIGLAFQGAVTNLAGGVMILLFHPFRVGDYIETTEIAGHGECHQRFIHRGADAGQQARDRAERLADERRHHELQRGGTAPCGADILRLLRL